MSNGVSQIGRGYSLYRDGDSDPAAKSEQTARGTGAETRGSGLVMSIGNQKFGIPGKYQYQIGIWYFCLIFLLFSRYFIGILSTVFLKFG